MRFRAIVRVQVEDSERVLAVLEQRLRAMVNDVERDGNRITLLGLGPSSRTVNRHDTTVIDVWAEDGVTTIGADVTFQASAFLGATGQEEIMRLKLERLFEETKEQLDFESRHDAARIARMEALVGAGFSSSRRLADEPRDTKQASAENTAVQHEPSSTGTQTGKAHKRDVEETIVAGASVKAETPAISSVAGTKQIAGDEEPIDNIDESQEADDEEASNRWIIWAVLAACIVAVLPNGVHYLSSLRADKAVPPPVVSKPQPAAPEPPKPVAASEPADLLRQWELAMRSRDAAAQASFYAVPVQRYFLRSNVSKAQVEADKQQQIDSRKGIWTVKMEKVNIKQNADNTATVTLVKHYMQQEDGKPVKEWFIPSQLKLKNEFGVWWITSERNLFATPAPATAFTP